ATCTRLLRLLTRAVEHFSCRLHISEAMWLRLAVLLLCMKAALSTANEHGLRPLDNARCWCDFESMATELQDLNKPDSNHAEQVFSFVNTLISLNFKLTNYFTDFRQCVRHWLDSIGQCQAKCSCRKDTVCCRDNVFGTLDKGILTLKKQVKQSFTAYSHIPFLNDYHGATFDIVNVYSGAFFEFLTALKTERTKAENEIAHFSAFYRRMEKGKPLDSIFAITMQGKNGSKSIVTRLADFYECDTTQVLPFYRNVYGVVLQFLMMRELHSELHAPQGSSPISQFSSEPEWKHYLRLSDSMTKQIIYCSSKEIYQIRSQEIKDKDMAMRNAAIVFSCFILALVIIIALIVFFACRSKAETTVTMREEPIGRSYEGQGYGHDALMKRYYETDA
ncbi:hypothetical protein BOX15_Mlig015559g2, partial [Macrostomum lignano]